MDDDMLENMSDETKDKLSLKYWRIDESSVFGEQTASLPDQLKMELIKKNYKVLESYKMRCFLSTYVGEVLAVGAVQMSEDGSNKNMIKPRKTTNGPEAIEHVYVSIIPKEGYTEDEEAQSRYNKLKVSDKLLNIVF